MKSFIYRCLLLFLPFTGNSQPTIGLMLNTANSWEGYTLFSPTSYNYSYLIDNCGKYIHAWKGTYTTGMATYLMENGNLLRTGNVGGTYFNSGGRGGVLEIIDWNDSLLWTYEHHSQTYCMHHDIEILPNGNILAVAWERKTSTASINNGRNPSLLNGDIWAEKIIEIQPTYPTGGNIVWEWHIWDHLVQDYNSAKLNYGVVGDHPELLNINYLGISPSYTEWLHYNSIDYNEELDQILISTRYLCEIYIIDHSTTTAEAAGHTGGIYGKGGDFLYRWGNPEAYNRGDSSDRKLFEPHSARWIESDRPDSGKIMIFNNGVIRPDGSYSSVDVINQPVDTSGNYSIASGFAYSPDTLDWCYMAPVPSDFYASRVSGAQRLPNGNTLIIEGPKGNMFEVDYNKNKVWNYICPVNNSGSVTQGTIIVGNGVFRIDR